MLVQEGVPEEKMVVIPNGIDPEIFSPDLSGEKVLQRYGLGESIIMGFLGWFRPWHGLPLARKPPTPRSRVRMTEKPWLR